jgi:hypothetical protein
VGFQRLLRPRVDYIPFNASNVSQAVDDALKLPDAPAAHAAAFAHLNALRL